MQNVFCIHNTITMFYNYYEDYQYDSCVSKGICSIGPRTSSLQEILIMYLKLLAFYTIELKSFGGHNKDAVKVILETISTLMANMEYQNKQFSEIILKIKTLTIDSKNTYLKICKEKDIQSKFIQTNIKLDEKIDDITSLIQQGEKEYTNRVEHLSPERKNLLEVISFIIKSLCINIIEIKSYSENEELADDGFYQILILLNFLNFPDGDLEEILDEIKKSANIDNKIYKRIQELKSERYGEEREYEVSFSTRPNKAILVAGSSLRELEDLLEYTKDKNIDIYTHGEMIQAHAYPKFHEYEHLRGHFGIGVENCLLDFATFPGGILITKFAAESVEYLYRGRLFTTDFFVPKGAIKIENNDYSKLVESANQAKGFKRGKEKEPVKIGYSKAAIKEKLTYLFNNKDKYKHIIIFAPETYNHKNKMYYENMLKNIPDDIFVISFSYSKEKDNIFYIDDSANFSIIYYILDILISEFKNSGIDISIFISKCDKHIISNIIRLKDIGLKHIFLSKCSPIMLNPALIDILTKYYDIIPANHPVDDLKKITG